MVGCVKDKIVSIFKTSITKDYNKQTSANNVYGSGKEPKKPKICKQSKDCIIKDIKYLFRIIKNIRSNQGKNKR